ncbi:hypothetical protein [Pseudarthrobacter oxydans]|uniref:hypothetical protein n=1 Tax=Pseudarthrobacter oxydans TaxID=1671 RepID=UPI00344D8A73
MKVLSLASSTLMGALWGALVPVLALLFLEPAQYGSFSTIYLIFAYGVSLQYSIVSEAWARARLRYRKVTNWSSYSSTLFILALTIGAVALSVSLILLEVREIAVWLGVAVCLGIYRSGARYHRMAVGLTRQVILADFLGMSAFVAVLVSVHGPERTAVLSMAWAASGSISVIALGLPVLYVGSGPIRWWRMHKRDITPLLADSTLMDVGAIGAPFLLAGFMGPKNFGLYRGVANAAMPVRLLLDPLRPTIGRKPPGFFFQRPVLWLIFGISFTFAALCYLALELLVPRLPMRLGTLSELAVFSHQAAVFAAASFLGTLFYVVCRNSGSRRTIMTGRILQTFLVVALPVIGFVFMGLPGAVWGFAVSASVSAVIWLCLAIPREAGAIRQARVQQKLQSGLIRDSSK